MLCYIKWVRRNQSQSILATNKAYAQVRNLLAAYLDKDGIQCIAKVDVQEH